MYLLNVFSVVCPFGIPKIQLTQLTLSPQVILPEFSSEDFDARKNKPVLHSEDTGLFFVFL
jgi:hypothetical protein